MSGSDDPATEESRTPPPAKPGRLGAFLHARFETLLAFAYVAWSIGSVFAGADRSSTLRGFRIPAGDHLTELVRVESWFLGALPLTGHPSTVGVTGPGPWYLYVTSLPTRLLGPLMGGNYLQASMLVNILLCTGLLLAGMRMARLLTGSLIGPAAVFSITATTSLLHHRVSPSPLMTRPGTVSYYATICLALGVLALRRETGARHLPVIVFSGVLLLHAYALNAPLVLVLGAAVLGPLVSELKRRSRAAFLAAALGVVGAAQVIAGWLIAPETLRFYVAGLAPTEDTDLIRNDLLGTLTTNHPLYDNEIGGWPPSIEFARLYQNIDGNIVWLTTLIVGTGLIFFLVLRRWRLAGLSLLAAWVYWSYLSLRPHLILNNAYALTPALGLCVVGAVAACTLVGQTAGSTAKHGGAGPARGGALITGLLLIVPLVVAATYRGSYWHSPQGWFFNLHADVGSPYEGIGHALRERYGEGHTYALQLDDVENWPENGADYRGAAVSTWLALELQGERSCVLLRPNHDRHVALTTAQILGTTGLCERNSMGPGTIELEVAVGLDPDGEVRNKAPVFVSPRGAWQRAVTILEAGGGVTVEERLDGTVPTTAQ